MSKLLQGVYAPRLGRNPDVQEWNRRVRSKLGPFFRRKSILSRDREILRTELMNLRKIERDPVCMHLLLQLVRLYRRGLAVNRLDSLQQLIALFPGTVTADENWMSLFMRAEWPASSSLQDLVQAQFDWLDVILEGCHKHHFRIFYTFALHSQNGAFPGNVASRDYGALVAGLPQTIRSRFRFLCEDPEWRIKVNQWRNIAAHKTFAIRSSRTLDITYGLAPNQSTLRIPAASLRRTLDWAKKALCTLRLASVIVLLEYMEELDAAGLPKPTLRLDSWLCHLFHNLRLVGFLGVSYRVERKVFSVDLIDVQRRPVRDAIIHASQVLDQMSAALRSDPAVRPSPDRACVRLIGMDGIVNAEASVLVSDALAHSEGKLTMAQYVARVDFKIELRSSTQPNGPADGGQPSSSEANRTSGAAGPRR